MKLYKYLMKKNVLLIAMLIGIWYPIVFSAIENAYQKVGFLSLQNLLCFITTTCIILIIYLQIDYSNKETDAFFSRDYKTLLIIFLYQLIIFGGLIGSFISKNFFITIFSLIIIVCLFVIGKYQLKNPYISSPLLILMYLMLCLCHVLLNGINIRVIFSGYMIILNIFTIISSICFSIFYKMKKLKD